MATGRTNAQALAGTSFSLVVSVTTGSIVTATKGSLSVSGTAASGSCVLTLPEAGTWTVSATLDGQTSNTQTVSVVDSYAVSLEYFEATITVTVKSGATVVCSNGSTSYTETSTGTAVFTITQTGTWTITATLDGQTKSGTVNAVSGTTSYSLALSIISTTLNENDWDTISEVSDAGEGASYWAVGDRKAITLNGTVGALTLSSVTTYAFILGFNHNSSWEGSNRIHFQLAKTALSGGADICFTDSSYLSTGSTTAFRMNTSSTNSGGWSSSYMRNSICGTSLTSYSGTIIAAIPDELRAVLKQVTKLTDNTGGGAGSSTSYITATKDYFFLLSEYEVFGTVTYGNTGEADRNAQYAYYAAGNSKVKYQHSATTIAASWWLRSPNADNSASFMRVRADGSVDYINAYISLGFAPGFCV